MRVAMDRGLEARGSLHDGAAPGAAEPEEDHDDPARDGRDRKREPDAEQPNGPRPPGGERHAEQRQRGAGNLRPQRITRPGERAFQNDLEGLADLGEGDHPQVEAAVRDDRGIRGEQGDERLRDHEKGDRRRGRDRQTVRSEEHTSELQSLAYLVCRLLLEKKKKNRRLNTSESYSER